MTPEQHKKYLAYSHVGYGGLFCLMMVMFTGLFIAMGLLTLRTDPNGPPFLFFGIMWLFMALFYGAMIVPSFIAGYGLLKGKKWARTATIIAGVVAGMSFPMGTAVCVYSFWFLFSEPGKAIFDNPNYALPAGREAWVNDLRREKEVQYTPPQSPPDWR